MSILKIGKEKLDTNLKCHFLSGVGKMMCRGVYNCRISPKVCALNSSDLGASNEIPMNTLRRLENILGTLKVPKSRIFCYF